MPAAQGPRKRVRTVRHFAISDKLRPADRAAVDAMLRAPDVCQRDVRLWLAARGCDVSLASVCRYRQRLLAGDREREAAAEDAESGARRRALYARLTRDGDVADTGIAGALVMLLEAIVFRSLMLLEPPADAGGRYFGRYAAAVKAMLDTRERFDAVCNGGAAPGGVAAAARPFPADALRAVGDLAAVLSAPEPPDATALAATPRRGGRCRTPWKMESLPADVLRRYEAEVIDDPKSTAASGRRWLRDAGFDVSLATVTRHRVNVIRRRRKESAAAAFVAAARAAAAAYRLTPADLAAGDAVRNRVALLTTLRGLHEALDETERPLPPEKLIAVAAAVRVYLR